MCPKVIHEGKGGVFENIFSAYYFSSAANCKDVLLYQSSFFGVSMDYIIINVLPHFSQLSFKGNIQKGCMIF